jgi:hypothetical protein
MQLESLVTTICAIDSAGENWGKLRSWYEAPRPCFFLQVWRKIIEGRRLRQQLPIHRYYGIVIYNNYKFAGHNDSECL